MRCPRCQRASPDDAVFCRGCGAPLTFRAEPTPRPLDLSISLDRRAGMREAVVAPALDGAGSATWDLAPPVGPAAARYPPPAPLSADEADDLEFGPIPELAPDLDPGPAPDLARSLRAAPEPTSFAEPESRLIGQERSFAESEPGLIGQEPAFAESEPGLIGQEPAFAESEPGFIGQEPAFAESESGLIGQERSFAESESGLIGQEPAFAEPEPGFIRQEPRVDRPFSRALGLAPDPVVPDDLGLANEDEPGGAPGPELPPRGRVEPRGAGLSRDLDLRRRLDLALPASAQPAQLPLPLRETGPRLRPARPARRAAAWVVDAAPLALLWAGALAALYDRVPLSPGDRAGLVERVLRDGGALALPLLAGVATLALVHQTLAHALAGATLGKRLLGLRVVSEDGERPSVERCAARAALSAASVLLLGLGLAPALFTRSGRALHDISAGTRVVESP